MTLEQILEEKEKVEKRLFMLQMIDRWDNADFDRSRELNNRLRELDKMEKELTK